MVTRAKQSDHVAKVESETSCLLPAAEEQLKLLSCSCWTLLAYRIAALHTELSVDNTRASKATGTMGVAECSPVMFRPCPICTSIQKNQPAF